MKEVRIDRRLFLRGAGTLAVGAAAASLSACGSGTSRSGDSSAGGGSKTVIVRDSGGAYGDANRKAIYDAFTKETGIQVQTVNVLYAQMLAQIQQGRPQFDLIDTSLADFYRFQNENALEPLNSDKLPNLKSAGLPQDLVTQHHVARNYWASVMAYRTDVFKGPVPQSWADFWDAGKFAGSRSLQGPEADLPELEFALLADGVPMDRLYPIDVDRAFKALQRIKGSVKKFWDKGAEPGLLLGRNEVVASSVWCGRLDELVKQGNPLAYQMNGARRQSNGYGIPKGASNIDGAHQLINFALRPDVQANYTTVYPGISPVVPAAYKTLSADLAPRLLSSPQNLDKGFDLDVKWWLQNQADVRKRWQEWSHA